jgi:prepilin-type processing-associated H-X9-DG protein
MNAALGASCSSWLPAPPYRLYQRQSDLGSPPPTQHFVIIDEHPASINDNTLFVKIPSVPAEAALVDYPASWHNGGAAISFADGRAEIHRWLDPRTKPDRPAGQPLVLNVPSPNNPDVVWLAARTSSRAP